MTLHFVHIPLPPQTLSRSTPNCLAASNMVVPFLTAPLKPEGVKTIVEVLFSDFEINLFFLYVFIDQQKNN